MPLVSGFSPDERKVVLERLIDLCVRYFHGHLAPLSLLATLYDCSDYAREDPRRFSVPDRSPGHLIPVFDLVPLEGPETTEWADKRLERFQNVSVEEV